MLETLVQKYTLAFNLFLLIVFTIGFMCGREYERMDEDEIIQKKKGEDELEKHRKGA